MSVLEVRGGIPHIFRGTIAVAGRHHGFLHWSKWLRIRVTGNPCKVFFTEADYTADNDQHILVPVAAAETPHGEWSGPVETEGVWLKGSGGNSVVEIVSIQRRA